MFFRNVTDQAFDEIHNRKSLLNISIIFVAVIMERNSIAIIVVNSGSSDHRPSKITSNVFGNHIWIAEIGFGIDIETMFVLSVADGFHLFERWSDFAFHFIKESSTESITQKVVVKVFYMTPEAVIAVTAFGKQAVNVRIPFEIPAERMENQDIAGSKISGMIQVEKHTEYHTGNRVKEAVQERRILKEKVAEMLIYGKNAVAVLNIEEFKGHTGGAFHRVLIAAGRAKAAVASKRDKFKVAAVWTAIHGTAKGRIAAMDHLINIFHLSFSGMKGIFNFFIMVCKDSL